MTFEDALDYDYGPRDPDPGPHDENTDVVVEFDFPTLVAAFFASVAELLYRLIEWATAKIQQAIEMIKAMTHGLDSPAR